MLRILNIAGARPNFMKIAPIMRAMKARADIDAKLIHTGQHYDAKMSDVFFKELGIPEPDRNLGVGSGTREEQIEQIMASFEKAVIEDAPDAVLVVGDVNSTIACARVAKRNKLPVIHVEAGLRSFDSDMPEEINRIETDKLSDLLYVTEQSGMDNLRNEEIQGRSLLVGNVMIDSIKYHLPQAKRMQVSDTLGLRANEYVVGTFHRPSNVDSKQSLARVMEIFRYISAKCQIVLPLHPRTEKSLRDFDWLAELEANPNILVTTPLSYFKFVSLIAEAKCVVTDSGGVQEETTFLRIPCITMRDNTERPVTVDVGSNFLAGTSVDGVVDCIDRVFQQAEPKGDIPPLWDGNAAERIVSDLVEQLSPRNG